MTETPDETIARLTAGADPTPAEPGTWLTPGQYIHRWNQMTETERLAEAEQVVKDRQMVLEHLMYPRRWIVNGEMRPEGKPDVRLGTGCGNREEELAYIYGELYSSFDSQWHNEP